MTIPEIAEKTPGREGETGDPRLATEGGHDQENGGTGHRHMIAGSLDPGKDKIQGSDHGMTHQIGQDTGHGRGHPHQPISRRIK